MNSDVDGSCPGDQVSRPNTCLENQVPQLKVLIIDDGVVSENKRGREREREGGRERGRGR